MVIALDLLVAVCFMINRACSSNYVVNSLYESIAGMRNWFIPLVVLIVCVIELA